jgi:Zn-dependent protease
LITTEKLLVLLVLVPVLVLSLMLHELAHGYTAYRLGDPTAKRMGRLSFNPIRHLDPIGTAMFFITYLFSNFAFGWAKPVPVSPYYFKNRQKGMALVGLAGPLTNFALAIVFVFILKALDLEPIEGLGESFLLQFVFMAFAVNIVLGIFNLIPVPPLDGSRIVGAFLPREAYEKWVRLDQFGMFLAIGALFIVFYTGILSDTIRALANVFLGNYPDLLQELSRWR